jgi:hypothetical protein
MELSRSGRSGMRPPVGASYGVCFATTPIAAALRLISARILEYFPEATTTIPIVAITGDPILFNIVSNVAAAVERGKPARSP